MMEFSCPVEATVHLIGGKYKSVILWHLKDQTLRYSALHRLVPVSYTHLTLPTKA